MQQLREFQNDMACVLITQSGKNSLVVVLLQACCVVSFNIIRFCDSVCISGSLNLKRYEQEVSAQSPNRFLNVHCVKK